MYRIISHKKISKFLRKHKGQQIVYEVEKAVFTLAINPYKNNLDIKPLANHENMYRVRLGKYRMIYEIFDEKIEIHFLDIDSRGGIYK